MSRLSAKADVVYHERLTQDRIIIKLTRDGFIPKLLRGESKYSKNIPGKQDVSAKGRGVLITCLGEGVGYKEVPCLSKALPRIDIYYMCFPSKRIKDNLSDPKSPKSPASTAPLPSQAPPPQTTSSPTTPTTALPLTMAPKVAIIIYSMYGHIAKCTFCPCPHNPTLNSTLPLQWPSLLKLVSKLLAALLPFSSTSQVFSPTTYHS